MERKITVSHVKFVVNGKREVKFTIYHSLPNVAGLSLNDYLNKWLERTSTFDDTSLVGFIRDRGTRFLVMTAEQYMKYIHPLKPR